MKVGNVTLELYVPQPAYKLYAFDRGWRIMHFVTMNLFKRIHASALGWFSKAGDLANRARYENWYRQYSLYVAVAGLGLGGATQYASASIVAGLFIALYAIVLGVWATLSMLLLSILAAWTFAYSAAHFATISPSSGRRSSTLNAVFPQEIQANPDSATSRESRFC